MRKQKQSRTYGVTQSAQRKLKLVFQTTNNFPRVASVFHASEKASPPT